MSKVPDEDGPMLCRIRILIDSLSDHLSQSRILGEPLAGGTTDGVPSNLDRPRALLELGLRQRDHVWCLSQADGVLEGHFSLIKVLLAVCFILSSALAVSLYQASALLKVMTRPLTRSH